MRIPCPLCGTRDLREFKARGAALTRRPGLTDSPENWDSFLHLRDNPAGPTEEFWHHLHGCGAWLVVRRDTTTHHIEAVWLASDPAPKTSAAPQVQPILAEHQANPSQDAVENSSEKGAV